MKIFEFKFYGNVIFGANSRSILLELINDNNWNKICLVIDQNLLKLEIINDLINSLNVSNCRIINCDISEPTYAKLEEKRIELDGFEIDLFIGIGGGSALDMAKGLSVLASNDGSAISYRGFDEFKEPILPIIAIPTTAGTGSEITPNASFIDTNDKRKMGINGEAIRPRYAILDPELTLSCPKAPTISAGVDSLVHATEAFVAKKSNPMAKMFAKNGFSLVFENLPLLINNLNNIKFRENVMYGAFLSAIALMNSGTGPAAAMSYPLGVHFGVPHGIGGGIFLPHIIQYNIDNGYFGYSEIDKFSNNKDSNKKISNSFIDKIWNAWSILDVPQDLSQFGMSNKDLDLFVSDTLDLKAALDQNPISFYENEIRSTLKKLNVG